MSDQYYGPLVRVRHDLRNAMLYVETKEADGSWKQQAQFDEMSNGYAHTEASRRAMSIRRTLWERENVTPANPTKA